MGVAILTDTNSGIGEDEAKSLGIFVVPMPVMIEEEVYFEGKNLTEDFFYDSLENKKSVSTSQPSPADLMEQWDELLKTYDEVVYIPMSSGLSGSCYAAKGFAQEYDGKVQVVDNHRISVTMRCSVIDAKAMADKGMSSKTIATALEGQGLEASIYLAVNSLEYLRRGGRISAAAEKLGTILNIKPVLTIQGEKIEPFSKVRGSVKKCQQKMLEAIARDIETRFSNIPQSDLRIGGAGTGLSESEKEEWVGMIKDAFPEAQVFYDPLSFSIGTHTGPGAVGIGVTY